MAPNESCRIPIAKRAIGDMSYYSLPKLQFNSCQWSVISCQLSFPPLRSWRCAGKQLFQRLITLISRKIRIICSICRLIMFIVNVLFYRTLVFFFNLQFIFSLTMSGRWRCCSRVHWMFGQATLCRRPSGIQTHRKCCSYI